MVAAANGWRRRCPPCHGLVVFGVFGPLEITDRKRQAGRQVADARRAAVTRAAQTGVIAAGGGASRSPKSWARTSDDRAPQPPRHNQLPQRVPEQPDGGRRSPVTKCRSNGPWLLQWKARPARGRRVGTDLALDEAARAERDGAPEAALAPKFGLPLWGASPYADLPTAWAETNGSGCGAVHRGRRPGRAECSGSGLPGEGGAFGGGPSPPTQARRRPPAEALPTSAENKLAAAAPRSDRCRRALGPSQRRAGRAHWRSSAG